MGNLLYGLRNWGARAWVKRRMESHESNNKNIARQNSTLKRILFAFSFSVREVFAIFEFDAKEMCTRGVSVIVADDKR